MALHEIRATLEAYERMVSAGVFDGRRVELVQGVVYEMTPQDSLHASSLRQVRRVLEEICPEACDVDVQMPLNVGLDSSPEPDLAIVRRDPLNYVEGHPTAALLVVEIADSSLARDRKKAAVYAQAGIEDYWIANLVRNVLEVYREPLDGTYRTRQVLRRGERITPLLRPDVAIAVDDLLPKKV
jgi:Uma2 family endonuclease